MVENEYSGKAMGTTFYISIICNSKKISDKLFKESSEIITKYEKKFSRFLANSELSILNKEKDLKVSREFMEVTKTSYELFCITKGIFNPLFQIERLGYKKTFDKIDPKEIIILDEDYNIDFYSTTIDEKKSRIILNKGQKLDFGGILKGYLSELLCKRIISSSKEINGVIVNIGGDIFTKGLDANNNKFIFDIYNPITKKDDISVEVYNSGLTTSGIYKRVWTINNIDYNHILDISGNINPSTDIISASVIYKHGSEAEAFAKVILTIGIEKSQNILKKYNIKYILIKKDGTIIKN